jgi:hypothetical protein
MFGMGSEISNMLQFGNTVAKSMGATMFNRPQETLQQVGAKVRSEKLDEEEGDDVD